MDLYDAASYHQLALSAAGRSPVTLRVYLLYEKRFIEYLEAKHIPATMDALDALNTRKAVLWFQQRRLGQRGGVVATAQFLNILKTWAAFLEQEGVWENSPLRRVQRMRPGKLERKPYTRTEVNAILHACDESRQPERDRLLVLLLLDSGARISEITGTSIGDVRFETRSVLVNGKGSRERTIPIGVPEQSDGGPVFRALRAWLKVRSGLLARHPERADDQLLLTIAGFPLTGEGGTDVVKRLGDAAGVDGAIPHRFRHTFATVYLTRYPGDEIGLRRIMGHVSKDVLADYIHLAQQALAQRAGRVSPTHNWLKEAGG